MVADKTDGRDDGLRNAFHRKLPDYIFDVGFEPRIGGFAAAALIGDGPARTTKPFSDQASRNLELFHVGRTIGHRDGNTVGGKNKRCCLLSVRWNLSKAGLNQFYPSLDKKGMVMPDGTVVNLRHVVSQLRPGVGDVFLIAVPARFGSVWRKNKPQRFSDSVAGHLFHCLNEEGTHVTHTDIDGERQAFSLQQDL